MKPRSLLLMNLLLMSPAVVAAETIYGSSCDTLFRFDSEAPDVILSETPISGIDGLGLSKCIYGLDFDIRSASLYGLALDECQIACPPPPNLDGAHLYRIDPATGLSELIWQGADESLGLNAITDLEVAGDWREIRMLSSSGANLRLALDPPHLLVDTPLTPIPAGVVVALAGGADGGGPYTTYAILGNLAPTSPELVRIGGPEGDPPASSGEVTSIASLGSGDLFPMSFDISPTGRAFAVMGVPIPLSFERHLFEVDLESGAMSDLGEVYTSFGRERTAIAVVPELGVVAIPALGRTGEAIFAVVLLWVAGSVLRRRLRQTPDSSGPSAS